jgi:hypothetical protein
MVAHSRPPAEPRRSSGSSSHLVRKLCRIGYSNPMKRQDCSPVLVDAVWLRQLSQGQLPPQRIALQPEMITDPKERSNWERQLNRDTRPCGCSQGALGLFIGLGLVIVGVAFGNGQWSSYKIVAAIAFPLVLLVSGKLIGRNFERNRFRRKCKQLLRLYATTGESHAQLS